MTASLPDRWSSAPAEIAAPKGRAKRICFDLDGTLCTNTFGAYDEAVPFPWAIERVNSLAAQGHHILIFTARGTATGIDWESVTKDQLARWDVHYHELHLGKPHADVYVDDRAVHTDAWRVADVRHVPGFGGAAQQAEEELPRAAAPDRSVAVEVTRTFGGRAVALAAHAERLLATARALGLTGLPAAEAVEAEVAAAAGAVVDDDLVLTLVWSPSPGLALLDTLPEANGPGLAIAIRRLGQVAEGLRPFVSDRRRFAVAASIHSEPGNWPLVSDSHAGLCDGLGGELALVVDGALVLAPDPGGRPTVAAEVIGRLARGRALEPERRPLTGGDLEIASEAFLVGLPFCLVPVAELNGRPLDTSLADELLAEWGREVGVDLAAQALAALGRAPATPEVAR